MNVCYLGPIGDHSGYGEANRNAIAALHTAGIKVRAKAVSYTHDTADFGKLGQLMTELSNNEFDYFIKILHTTPDQYEKYMEPGKYHIGHFFWETDRVPQDFATGLNLMNEVWTGSKANEEAMRTGGVKVPIFIYPQATETSRPESKHYQIRDFDGYLFYSVFEWIDRKNWQGLLNAYYSEFDETDNVGLLIKTYRKNFTRQQKQSIIDDIKELAADYPNKRPPVFVYRELMERNQVMRLHATGDAFISAHHGEGWGIPQVEAMLAHKPVISTSYGGVHEYLDEATYLPVGFSMGPVRGMEQSRWYGENQNWAEPDGDSLRAAMRWCYENQDKADLIGRAGKKLVKSQFGYRTVGAAMAARLDKIMEGVK